MSVAFPEDPLGIQIEAQAGGTWTDVTGDTYTRDVLSFSGGRGDEAGSADPGKCTLTLNNKDGKYSPKNPQSPLYGLIGRNTPLRVSVRAGESHMDLDGDPANYASTPDAAALDVTGDLDVRAEIGTQWWDLPDLGRSLLSKWEATGDQRSWDLRLLNNLLRFTWTPDGTFASSLTVSGTLPRLPHRAAVRATLDVDDGAGGSVITVWWAESLDGPWYSIFEFVHTSTTSVYASTAPLRIGGNDPTTTPPRTPFEGEAYRAEVRSGIDGTVVASPDFRALTPGATGFTDSAGRAWTLSGTAEVTNRATRFYGEVSSWPPKWAPSGNDVWVPLEASGILRRLGQGAKPLDSTMKRRIPSFGPAAYWPMEDGQSATQMYSPVAGVTPLQLYGSWQMSGDDTLAGSSSLPQLGENAELRGAVPRTTGDGWQLDFVYHMATAPSTDQTLIRFATSGTWRHVRVAASASAFRVYGYDDDGTAMLLLESTSLGVFSDSWTRFQIWATQDGSDVDLHVGWVQLGVSGFALDGSYTARAGRISGVYTTFGAFENAAVGHLAVFHGSDVDTFTGADLGFQGETTRNRMRRLAEEETVPLAMSGDQTTAPQMGPQRPETLLDLFGDAADVDGGMFGEERDSLSLLYRSRESLYGQDPVLTLDYENGEIAPPLEPVDDDQRVRNDITVTRKGGSSARVVQEDGPLSVAAPPDGVGVYNESVTVNLYSDAQTEEVAGWRLHLGTWDEARYPAVTLRLHKAPHLIPDFLRLKAGDKIRLTNLPPWLPPGDVELLVEGWDEQLLPRRWEATLTCSPAGPWNIGIVEDDDFGRVDTDGSELAAGVDEDDTALSVAGPVWTTDLVTEGEFDIRLGGEVMTVTAVTGTSSPQTFTVVRSVNGITKSHDTGADVRLAHPAIVGR